MKKFLIAGVIAVSAVFDAQAQKGVIQPSNPDSVLSSAERTIDSYQSNGGASYAEYTSALNTANAVLTKKHQENVEKTFDVPANEVQTAIENRARLIEIRALINAENKIMPFERKYGNQ